MGVRDYLVRPVPDEDLVGVIAKSLVDKRGLAHSRIVAVMGAKGGVGATSVAQMLSVSIARDLKQKTLLMDLAGTGGSLGVGFGLEPTTSLTEALRVGASGSDDDMRRILQASGDNLSVIVTGGEALLNDSPDPDAVEALLNRVMQKNPVVVVDLSSASHAVRKRVLSLAAHTVLVATPLLPPLRNARTLLTEIKSMRGKQVDLDLVVNMIGMAGGDEVPLKDIKAALDLEPALKIPYQPKIFAHAEATGKPVAEAKGAQEIMAALLPVAARAAKAEVEAKEDGKGKKGGLGLFRGLGKK
jgi:pilus assembly protein CpaE